MQRLECVIRELVPAETLQLFEHLLSLAHSESGGGIVGQELALVGLYSIKKASR